MRTKANTGILSVLVLAAMLYLSACSVPAATGTDKPVPTAAPTAAITEMPTSTATPEPTVTATETPQPTATPEPTPNPTPEPTASPDPTPTPDPDAPPVLRLYFRNTRKLAAGYDGNLIRGENNAEFFALPTDKKSVEKIAPKALVEKYWGKYRKEGYQIGYSVDITLKSGETIHLNIRRPKDAPPIQHEPKYFSKFVEIYMYDSARLDPNGKGYGSWHLQQRFIKEGEDVLITSIKFHAGSRYSEVASIGLKAYVYKGDSEFDADTGEYIGNNSAEISIVKSK